MSYCIIVLSIDDLGDTMQKQTNESITNWYDAYYERENKERVRDSKISKPWIIFGFLLPAFAIIFAVIYDCTLNEEEESTYSALLGAAFSMPLWLLIRAMI